MALVLDPVEIAKYTRLPIPGRDRFAPCLRKSELPAGVDSIDGKLVQTGVGALICVEKTAAA